MMKTRLIKTALISLGLTTALSVSASQDLSQKSWEEIVAQAKQEGSVTFSVWYLQPQFRLFVKDFEKTYGIKVKIPEGTLDGNMNKLIAEKSLSKGKMDVIAITILSCRKMMCYEISTACLISLKPTTLCKE